MATSDKSLFHRERWLNIAFGLFFFFLVGGWFFLPPLLLGLAVVWPLRNKVVVLFHAQQRWEKELAIGLSGLVVGVLVFLMPYAMFIKHYSQQQ